MYYVVLMQICMKTFISLDSYYNRSTCRQTFVSKPLFSGIFYTTIVKVQGLQTVYSVEVLDSYQWHKASNCKTITIHSGLSYGNITTMPYRVHI